MEDRHITLQYRDIQELLVALAVHAETATNEQVKQTVQLLFHKLSALHGGQRDSEFVLIEKEKSLKWILPT